MNTDFYNIGMVERVMRLLLGSLLLVMVFNSEFPPHWFALTAPYPIITAIMAWDPVYALINELKSKFSSHKAPVGREAHA